MIKNIINVSVVIAMVSSFVISSFAATVATPAPVAVKAVATVAPVVVAKVVAPVLVAPIKPLMSSTPTIPTSPSSYTTAEFTVIEGTLSVRIYYYHPEDNTIFIYFKDKKLTTAQQNAYLSKYKMSKYYILINNTIVDLSRYLDYNKYNAAMTVYNNQQIKFNTDMNIYNANVAKYNAALIVYNAAVAAAKK